MSEPNSGARLAEPDVPAGPARPTRTPRLRGDLIAVALALLLVGAATAVGEYYNRPGSGVIIFAFAPPLFGGWLAHVGPGTPLAVMVGIALVAWGPALAERLSWRRLLALGYPAALAWTMSLALIDGWTRGFTERLTDRTEYLSQVPGITDIPQMLREFTRKILDFQPDSWTTHISGHPPLATLIFVWLDRLGLGGGAWAATACVLFGCLAAVAVPATISLLGNNSAARASWPFVIAFPGAIWVGASADALFAGVGATGVALLALSARQFARRSRWAVATGLAAGLTLGATLFLSYGLALFGLVALVVGVLARSLRALLLAAVGVGAVTGVFALAGFWWVDGYHLVVQRYYQGVGQDRPYSYWVWADLACVVIAVGPAIVAGLRRVGLGGFAVLRDRAWRGVDPVLVVAAAAAVAILLADLSGLSKAEVERIWLPFMVWLLPAAALLPRPGRRWWLAAQVATALLVNHLVLTIW